MLADITESVTGARLHIQLGALDLSTGESRVSDSFLSLVSELLLVSVAGIRITRSRLVSVLTTGITDLGLSACTGLLASSAGIDELTVSESCGNSSSIGNSFSCSLVRHMLRIRQMQG